MLQGVKIAILGLPNVGKSTLANQLFGQQRSITADLPGTTRDWVDGWANLDGLPARVIDTPGIRAATDPLEAQAIAGSRGIIAQADLRLLILDWTRPLAGEQLDLIHLWPDAILVINKTDQPGAWPADIPERIGNAVHLMATRGLGLPELIQKIHSRMDCKGLPLNRPACWTVRQRRLVTLALASNNLDPVRQVLGE